MLKRFGSSTGIIYVLAIVFGLGLGALGPQLGRAFADPEDDYQNGRSLGDCLDGADGDGDVGTEFENSKCEVADSHCADSGCQTPLNSLNCVYETQYTEIETINWASITTHGNCTPAQTGGTTCVECDVYVCAVGQGYRSQFCVLECDDLDSVVRLVYFKCAGE